MTPSTLSVRATAADARILALIVEVDLAVLTPLLPAPLAARRLFGASGGVSVQFSEVRSSAVGSYRECILSVLCKDPLTWPLHDPDAWSSPAGFPVWIAVTSEPVQRYGVEVWSYPKWVGEVDFRLEDGRFRGFASIPGRGSVSVRTDAAVPSDLDSGAIVFRSLSVRGAELLPCSIPGRARLASDWDPEAEYVIEVDALGGARIDGRSSAALYAEEYSYEVLAPTPMSLSSLAGKARRSSLHE